jgi:hypothetical protein
MVRRVHINLRSPAADFVRRRLQNSAALSGRPLTPRRRIDGNLANRARPRCLVLIVNCVSSSITVPFPISSRYHRARDHFGFRR